MVKTEELRIGNYIAYKGKSRKIKGVTVQYIQAEPFPEEIHPSIPEEQYKNQAVEIPIAQAEPIRLSEEILKKAGFRERSRGTSYEYFYIFDSGNIQFQSEFLPYGPRNMEVYYQVRKISHYFMDNEYFQTTPGHSCKYLHQLQNLYYIHEQKEMTITI